MLTLRCAVVLQDGGAVYAAGPLVLTGGSFTGTSSGASGGAVFGAASVTVTSAAFSSTSAVKAGGAAFAGGAAVVSAATFYACSATRDGGAVYANASLQIDSCAFQQAASRQGSGGAVLGNAALALLNSTFSSCAAALNGGSVAAPAAAGPAFVQGSAFLGSLATVRAYSRPPSSPRSRSSQYLPGAKVSYTRKSDLNSVISFCRGREARSSLEAARWSRTARSRTRLASRRALLHARNIQAPSPAVTCFSSSPPVICLGPPARLLIGPSLLPALNAHRTLAAPSTPLGPPTW